MATLPTLHQCTYGMLLQRIPTLECKHQLPALQINIVKANEAAGYS